MEGYAARFGGIERLYGQSALAALRRSHVAVIGVGGVGSWAAEAIVRSGVGRLTLVDFDEVCITNVNRQLPAQSGSFGKPKVEVLCQRFQAINPDCEIIPLMQFLTAANAEELLAPRFHYLVDAIDQPAMKALLIARCRDLQIPCVTAGAAGGRQDPTQVSVVDLARSTHDRLLQNVRKMLRSEYGFPRRPRKRFGVECVYSPEAVVYPQPDGSVCATKQARTNLRLDCRSGYGTATFVTGTFGFAAAARAIQHLTTCTAR